MTPTIDITQPELARLLALDAADKARRAKISARAFEREARKRERAMAGAMLGSDETPGRSDMASGTFTLPVGVYKIDVFPGGGSGGGAGGSLAVEASDDQPPITPAVRSRPWPATLGWIGLGAALATAVCVGGHLWGFW